MAWLVDRQTHPASVVWQRDGWGTQPSLLEWGRILRLAVPTTMMTLLAALPAPSAFGDVLVDFLSILFEGAPYILIGTIFSGCLDAFLPSRSLERVVPRNGVLAVMLGGLMGLVFPVCECAIVPVIRRLVQKGLPLGCAVTYMLAAPIVNPVVALSTITAFKEYKQLASFDLGALAHAPMTLGRLSLGYAVAVIVGLIVLRLRPAAVLKAKIVEAIATTKQAEATAPASAVSFDSKLVNAMRTAMRDFLDTGMYFVIGAAITAAFHQREELRMLLKSVSGDPMLATPTLMVFAVVLSLCSTSDAFIAAPMIGFSNAAKLAFLVFGPMMDIKLLFMYSSVFQRRVVLSLLIGLFLLILALSGPWAAWMLSLAPSPTP
jgi:uncharacterized protein